MRSMLTTMLLGLALCLAGAAAAQQLGTPKGPVILTISGAIGKSNRGPFDPAADKLADAHDLKFEKAAAFDRAMLEKLGLNTLQVKHANWPKGHTFQGPLLKDLMAAVGVTKGTLRPIAVDGYAADIPFSDLEAYPIILAVKKDGRYLELGQTGPTRVIYPYNKFPALRQQDTSKWVWAIYHIRVD